MPEYRSSGREPRRDYDERYARSSAAHNGHASRNGSHPPQGRRPAPRRRKKKMMPRFFLIAAILVVAILALVMILGGKDAGDPQAQPNPVSTNVNPPVKSAHTAIPADQLTSDTISQMLGDESADLSSLAASITPVQVDDLSINPNLPQDWLNILLLGTDERSLSESARTDTMIICSINRKTGEVKLTSILRDMAVELEELDGLEGLPENVAVTQRINSANLFGGPKYAMKTVNECFDMNIEHYVTVNFFGFERIARALGGIEVDITKAEMDEINNKQLEQYRIAKKLGLATKEDYQLLTTYGPNTHLDGNQTLAYARVRAIDSDVSRAERQRTVLVKLMEKLKGRSITELAAMAASLSGEVTMNLDLNTVLEIAVTVLSNGMPQVETLRIPAAGTYKEERRGERDMLYDTDYATNALNLYNFIYE